MTRAAKRKPTSVSPPRRGTEGVGSVRTFRPRRIQGTRVRCIKRYEVPGGDEVVVLNEIGVVESVRGDCVIIQFDDHEKHPFPIKLPRSHVEPADKFKGENE
jgi:hypothetical protein